MNTSKKYSIYIVEDNDLYAMILEHNLKDSFLFNSTTFASGEDCINSLNNNPDLVILDYNLKGMNGLETLKQIKKIKPTLPVIVVSSQTDLQIALDLMNQGADDYIEKNNNPIQKLVAAIEKIQAKKK